MASTDAWFACRLAFVEVVRAVTMSVGHPATVHTEWAEFDVVDLDQSLAERAADLAIRHRMRSLDAIHLAAALSLRADELLFASWDDRLSEAAAAEGLTLLPR